MVSDDSLRPRRALPADDEPAEPTEEATSELPQVRADTAEANHVGPRHAVEAEAAGDPPAEVEASAPTRGDLSEPEETPITTIHTSPSSATRGDEELDLVVEHAPFMRPGSVPDEVLSAVTASSPDEPAVTATTTSAVASPGAAAPADSTAAQSTAAQSTAAQSTAADSPTSPAPADDADAISAGGSRRRGFGLAAKVAVAVLVPAVALGAFFGVREFTKKAAVVVTQTPTPSVKTPSATPTPPFATAALISVADATKAFGNANWSVAHTWETVGPGDDGITCMSALPPQPAPILTRQQSLVSKAQGSTAVLQRIDAFGSPELAKQAYAQRVAALAACNDVPALIRSAAAVSGVGDESFSMTITFEDATNDVQHTVLVARSGVSVSMTDVANLTTPITPDKVAVATGDSLGRLCATSGGTCPTGPKATIVAIPKTALVGWLAQSDLPRVTKGSGMWSPTDVVNVTSAGSQCEDLTLATAEGPTARQQRSYLLTQDQAAPANFGVDQVEFAFKDLAAAQTFSQALTKNIDECGTRTSTAQISDEQNVRITGDGGVLVTGRIWTVTQQIQGQDDVRYRVAVMQAGPKVTYLISNTTASFDFTKEAWIMVAARAGQRITQA